MLSNSPQNCATVAVDDTSRVGRIELFHDRLGIDVAARVTALVERLLTPFTTDKLWALERLAWNPQTLMRVVIILAQLS